jgi:hypothetical protein
MTSDPLRVVAARVNTRIGVPILVSRPRDFCAVIQPADRSYTVFLNGDPDKTVAAVEVDLAGLGVRTDRGIGIGSTLTEALAAYPEATLEPGFSGSGPTVIADYTDGTSLRFDVDPSTKKVSFIMAGAHDPLHAIEICG